MNKICENCKYWNRKNRGECYNTSNKNYASCSNEHFFYGNLDADDKDTDLLVYSDYEGYAAGFSTGKDFGCIYFTSTKSPQDKPLEGKHEQRTSNRNP